MANLSKIQRMLKEAAEKGLDLSPEARKARAVEQGYMTGNDMHRLLENHKPTVELSEVGDNHPYLLKGAKELLVDGQTFAAGSDDYLNQILQHRSDEFLPTSTQSTTGLKRHAYMRMFPSQHTDPDFDINAPMTFYHGTAGDIASFNPNYLGRSTNAASAEHGTFFTNNPLDADDYANIAQSRNPKEARTLDLMSRLNDDIRNAEKHKELYERYNMKDHGGSADFLGKQDDYIERLRNRMRRIEAGLGTDNYSSVYPVHLRPENPMLIDKRGQGYGDITKSLQKAKDQGHDSVVFYDIRDPRLDSTHVVMFDPSKIRSTNAIFDPEKINSRDLLAGFGTLGAAGLLMEQEPVQEYAGGGAVKASKKLLESFMHPTQDGEMVEILKNPTRKELLDLAKNDYYQTVKVNRERGGDENVFAWMGSEPIHHSELFDALSADGSKRLDRGIFKLEKGSLLDDTADDDSYEKSLKEFLINGYASGGKVAKQGAAALRELLENLHKTDPERMRRAEEAGFDTDNIWLRGSSSQPKPDEFNFFTKDPSIADLYSTSYHRNTFDNTPNVVPVFVKKGVNAYDFDNHFLQKDADSASRHISKLNPSDSYILKNIMDDAPTGGDVYSVDDLDDIVEQTLQDQYVAKLNDAKSIFNNFMPEDLESNKFAKGGKVGPAAAYDESSESLETALRSLMDAYTLAQSDEMMGGLGAAYAKMMRPELFDDIDYSTLADAAAANSEAERHRLEEEHPVASALGMLASVPAYASFGGASLAGQMGANALLGGAYRYGDHEDPLDPTSVGIDLALPAAFRNLKRTAQGLALAIPAVGLSGDSDLELSSLRDLVHNVPDNYRIRP